MKRATRTCALGAAVVAMGVGLVAKLPFAAQSLLFGVALVLWGWVVWGELRSPRLDVRFVAAMCVIVFGLAVAAPPRTSNDVWSYAMYGRIAAAHHDDPYTHVPSRYAADPMLARVNPRWRSTPPVYGPLFVVVATAIAHLAGSHPLTTRLLYQVLAAVCGLLALGALGAFSTAGTVAGLAGPRRRGRPSASALVIFGLSPVTVVAGVNGAHVDLWVLALVIAGALAVARSRWPLAGVALGLAASIKITAALVVLGVVVWLVARRAWSAAAWLGGVSAAVVTGGYLLAGRHSIDGLRSNANLVSRASAWMVPRWMLSAVTDRHLDRGLVTAASLLTATVVVWLCGRRGRRGIDGVGAMVVASAATVAVAAYVLPWYSVVVLWLSVWAGARRWIVFSVVQSSLIFAAHLLAPSPTAPPGTGHPFKWLEAMAALGALAAFVWCVRADRAPAGEPRRNDPRESAARR